MAEPLQARIAAALQQVVNPRTGRDVVDSGMIRDVGVSVEGKVRFTILLDARDPASLVREVRQAVERVAGVSDVRVDVKDPSQAEPSRPGAMPGRPAAGPAQGRALPVVGQEPQSRRAAAGPAPPPAGPPNVWG